MSKSRDAFRTISEVSDALDTPAHVLRFWESKFSQVKPVKRAGGRRYYRPTDVDLLAGIKKLLHDDGMTIKGAQKLLREQGVKHVQGIGSAVLGADTPGPVIDATPKPEPTPAPEVKSANVTPLTNPAAEPAAPVDADSPMAAQAEEPAPEQPTGPALTLDLSANEDTAPTTQAPADTPAWRDLPLDPSDNASKAPARLFHLLQKAEPEALRAQAGAIAPLLARMTALRGRISLR